jgi:hypothetical protein
LFKFIIGVKMKKLYFLIIMIIVFFTSANLSFSVCPPGWDSYNYTYSYLFNNDECDITVYYCCTTLPSGTFVVRVDMIQVEIPCGFQVVGLEDFWEDFYNRLSDTAIYYGGSFPPCDDVHSPIKYMEIRKVLCWKLHNLGGGTGLGRIVDCGYTGQCIWNYKLCTNYNYTPPKNEKIPLGRTAITGENCSSIPPIVPPQGYGWGDEWWTECYIISCYD